MVSALEELNFIVEVKQIPVSSSLSMLMTSM